MKLNCINVGYGDAFLFQSDSGLCLLDTGSGRPDEYEGFAERVSIIDYLLGRNIHYIDHVILTHIHEDHVGNLCKLLENISVGNMWIPRDFGSIKDIEIVGKDADFRKNSSRLFFTALREFAKALDICHSRHIAVEELGEGDYRELIGVAFTVLGSKQYNLDKFLDYYKKLQYCDDWSQFENIIEKMDAFSNNTSLLLKVEYESLKALFCSDNVPSNWSDDAKARLDDVNFIKLAHHGQQDALDSEIMRNIPLEFCITTASSERRYNSANPLIYKTLREWAIEDGRTLKVLFTDPSSEYKDFPEVEYGNRSIEFDIGDDVRYQYEK